MTKIVFMGTPAFSAPILTALIEAGYDVLAVVTQPDRPVGRKRVLTPPPVKEVAMAHDLEVLQPEKISGSPEMARVIELAPDLIVTAAFGQFLPEKLIQSPKYGAVNVHASLLPKYRGGAPVHYAIMNGEKETGVTIMEMIKKMDAGDIITQATVSVDSEDNVGTMFDKLSVLGKDLLIDTLPDYLSGKVTGSAQDESQVTFSPNISREEESIDWTKTATEVRNQVRGMNPWPVAHTLYQDNRWKIFEGTVLSEMNTTELPGTIIKADKHDLWIACGQGTVFAVETIQPAGKGKMSVTEFLNGSGKTIENGQQVG